MKWYSTSVPVADHGDHCCRESIKFTSGGGAFVGAGRPFCVAADWRHYGGASEDHSRFRDELASGREASKQQRHFSLSASGLPLHASMSMRSWSRCWSPPPLPPLEGRSCRASQGLKGKMDGLPHPSFLPRLCPPTPHTPPSSASSTTLSKFMPLPSWKSSDWWMFLKYKLASNISYRTWGLM